MSKYPVVIFMMWVLTLKSPCKCDLHVKYYNNGKVVYSNTFKKDHLTIAAGEKSQMKIRATGVIVDYDSLTIQTKTSKYETVNRK